VEATGRSKPGISNSVAGSGKLRAEAFDRGWLTEKELASLEHSAAQR
jgi:hypothetical protein